MTTVFSVLLVVCYFATRGFALSCPPWPCDQSLYCSFDTSQCLYGVVKDTCYCCSICAKGPGEECGGTFGIDGRCTNGSTCIISLEYGLPYSTYLHSVGTCKEKESPADDDSPLPSSTLYPTSTLLISPSPMLFYTSTTSSSSPSPIPTPKPKVNCRTPCSVNFCWDGRNRYCSSNSTTSSPFNTVKERIPCQHTTCKACRLHVSPNCSTCPVPVNKRCLRAFFLCLAEHYKRDDILLELSDPRALTAVGNIMCNVPLLEVMESGSGEN